MMYVPYAKEENTMFELRSGFLEQNDMDIPVFEAMVKKSIILYDQDVNLMLTENLVQGVNGVNGNTLKVGSMDEVNTNGNWPKNPKKNNKTKAFSVVNLSIYLGYTEIVFVVFDAIESQILNRSSLSYKDINQVNDLVFDYLINNGDLDFAVIFLTLQLLCLKHFMMIHKKRDI